MVAPLVIAGIAAVTAAVQLYNSEKTRGATRKRLKELEKLYNSLIPPDYDLTIEDPPQLHDEKIALPKFSGPEAAPKWNLEKLEPEDLKLVQKYIPQVAPRIIEENPTLIEKTPEMKQGLDAQKTALRKFMSIGEGDGFDPDLQQKVQNARDRAQAESQSRSESTMQDFARRGMGGSGMELAAKMGGASHAMDRNASMGLQAEAEAYRNQLNALSQGAQIGGQVYGQEASLQGRNADIINSFNQRMSKRHQDWEQMRSDAMNQADLRNIQEAQRIADYNVGGRNEADQQHRQRLDQLTKFDYDAKIRERDRTDDNQKWTYGAQTKQRAYDDQKAILQAKWRQANTESQNNLKSRMFDDQSTIIAGKAGMTQARNQQDTSAGQDQNAAIQGLGNAAMSYGMQQNNQTHQKEMARDYGYKKGGY